MIKIKMLETRLGSENGYQANVYRAGHTYTVSEFLAEAFFIGGSAVAVNGPPDDGFIEPCDYGGHNELETQALKVGEPIKRGRGRPKKNG